MFLILRNELFQRFMVRGLLHSAVLFYSKCPFKETSFLLAEPLNVLNLKRVLFLVFQISRSSEIFDVVATSISPLIQQKHMQLRPCLDTHRTRLPTNFHSESRHICRDSAVFSVSPRVADISQIHERNPLRDLFSGDSFRLEAAHVHAHWYCKGSVRFLGRSVCCNMLAENRVHSRQSTPSHTSPKLQFVRNWSIDRF